MKRYLVFCLVFVLLFTPAGCSQTENETQPGTAAPEAGETDVPKEVAAAEVQAGTVSIEITPPEGWTKNEESVIPLHYLNGTASLMIKEEPYSGNTLDAVLTEALDMFGDSFTNFKTVGDIESLTVDGKDAKKMTFTAAFAGIEMTFDYIFLFVGNDVYVITFSDFADSFDTLADDFEAILQSVRFKTR